MKLLVLMVITFNSNLSFSQNIQKLENDVNKLKDLTENCQKLRNRIGDLRQYNGSIQNEHKKIGDLTLDNLEDLSNSTRHFLCPYGSTSNVKDYQGKNYCDGTSFPPCNVSFPGPSCPDPLNQDGPTTELLKDLGHFPNSKYDFSDEFQRMARISKCVHEHRDLKRSQSKLEELKLAKKKADREKYLNSKAQDKDIRKLIDNCKLDNQVFAENMFIQETICNLGFTNGFKNKDVIKINNALNSNTRRILVNQVNNKVFEDSLRAIYTSLPLDQQKRFLLMKEEDLCRILRTHNYVKSTGGKGISFFDAQRHPRHNSQEISKGMGACESVTLPSDLKKTFKKVKHDLSLKPPIESIFNQDINSLKSEFDSRFKVFKKQCSDISVKLSECMGDANKLDSKKELDIKMFCIEQNKQLFTDFQSNMQSWTKEKSFILLTDEEIRERAFRQYGSSDGLDLNEIAENCIYEKNTFESPSASTIADARDKISQSMIDRLIHESKTRSPDYNQGLVFFGDNVCNVSEDDKRQLNVLFNYLRSHPHTITELAKQSGYQKTYLNAICDASKCIKEIKDVENKTIDYAKKGANAVILVSTIIPGAQVLTVPFTAVSSSLGVLQEARAYNDNVKQLKAMKEGASTNGYGDMSTELIKQFSKLEIDSKESLKSLHKSIMMGIVEVKLASTISETLTNVFEEKRILKRIMEIRKRYFPNAPEVTMNDVRKLSEHLLSSIAEEGSNTIINDLSAASVSIVATDVLLTLVGSKYPLEHFKKGTKENIQLVLKEGKNSLLDIEEKAEETLLGN